MKNDNKGVLYWITGLSGAGKTTIGKTLFDIIRKEKPNVLFLDGDVLRSVLGNDYGHSIDERKQLAMNYCRLCKMITDQGVDVVCSTISLFKEVHDYNRNNISKYMEIYIDCSMDELIKRDQKGIYSKAMDGSAECVMGVNTSYDKPSNCDIIIDNSFKDNIHEKAQRIYNFSNNKFEG